MKKTYLFLILETILNMLTVNLSAIIIIPLFVIGVDLLIRLFIKNDSLAKGLDKLSSIKISGWLDAEVFWTIWAVNSLFEGWGQRRKCGDKGFSSWI